METADQNLWAWAIFILLVIDVMIFAGGYCIGRLHRQRSTVALAPSAQPADEPLASALSQEIAGLSEQLRSIEAQLSKVYNQSPRRQVKSAEGDRLQYATRMAEQGNSIEELMAVCNLGRGEAELIKLLHDAREIENQNSTAIPQAAEQT
jgi:hypothetical protein